MPADESSSSISSASCAVAEAAPTTSAPANPNARAARITKRMSDSSGQEAVRSQRANPCSISAPGFRPVRSNRRRPVPNSLSLRSNASVPTSLGLQNSTHTEVRESMERHEVPTRLDVEDKACAGLTMRQHMVALINLALASVSGVVGECQSLHSVHASLPGKSAFPSPARPLPIGPESGRLRTVCRGIDAVRVHLLWRAATSR